MRLIEKEKCQYSRAEALYFTKFRPQNIAVDDKTLFRRTKNYHAQETSSLTRKVREDKGGKTTREESRGSRIFLRGGAPLRNGTTNW